MLIAEERPVMLRRHPPVQIPDDLEVKEGTIEYLFKDYSGGCFMTELTNPVEPVGNEQW